eukprot:CAMPEP_0182416364 /NCGR_PEP_ID=MMETSP1167-20130531/642_1 /TAXON_ID=2988 /ORGANISM="Mallomonas Sp, Strain CCMP3275" /LENGTH=69 /DNA_ID=CAMNT_0024589057 /DNA_START=80 /DNA_END=289 /DNA_ORIENTATION=+
MADVEPSKMGGSSKYAKAFEIPPEFPELLRNFSREVLRNQPDDINKFAYQYFLDLLNERAMSDGGQDRY